MVRDCDIPPGIPQAATIATEHKGSIIGVQKIDDLAIGFICLFADVDRVGGVLLW
jgi:hypothetical protein